MATYLPGMLVPKPILFFLFNQLNLPPILLDEIEEILPKTTRVSSTQEQTLHDRWGLQTRAQLEQAAELFS